MPSAVSDSPQQSADDSSSSQNGVALAGADGRKREKRNFLVLAGYQVVMRTGWIFKTESIIMPVVLDTLGGGAWLRGCLPMLSRFGQSVPPLLLARRVKLLGRKKFALATCSLVMASCFLALSLIWAFIPASSAVLAIAFLFVYALFFAGTGVNQMCFSTLQGKLVQTTRRGRLMLLANVVGATCAIFFAAWLLPGWISAEGGQFAWIFAFSGCCFALAAFATLLLAESPDQFTQPRMRVRQVFVQAATTLRRDVAFRRVAIVAALFGTSIMLFPHYQALGRGGRLQMDLTSLIWWVIVQNAGTAVFSILVGPMADRSGNRLVLRVALLAICAAPLTALALARWGSTGRDFYAVVFLLVGLTPVVIRTFQNYALEIAKPEDHPRCLSTLTLCLAMPSVLSPLVGRIIDWFNFDAAFLGITSLVFAGWLMTFRLQEPRHHLRSAEADAPLPQET